MRVARGRRAGPNRSGGGRVPATYVVAVIEGLAIEVVGAAGAGLGAAAGGGIAAHFFLVFLFGKGGGGQWGGF